MAIKSLVSTSIINRYKNTYEEVYLRERYIRYSDFVKHINHEIKVNKRVTESQNQAAFSTKFLEACFDYRSQVNSSAGRANLRQEVKMPNSATKVDIAAIDKEGNIRLVVELKGSNITDLTDGTKKDLSAIHQCALYTFQLPKCELSVVSNFKDLYVFRDKEGLTNYYDLLNMSYDDFAELYTIMSYNSVMSGLTTKLINLTEFEEKEIDSDFAFLSYRIYSQIVSDVQDDKIAADLFFKFYAVMILEDQGRLQPFMVDFFNNKYRKTLDEKKYSMWKNWVEFFDLIINKKLPENMINDKTVYKMKVFDKFNDYSQLNISNKTLDMIYELSTYDFTSIDISELIAQLVIAIIPVKFESDIDPEKYVQIVKELEYNNKPHYSSLSLYLASNHKDKLFVRPSEKLYGIKYYYSFVSSMLPNIKPYISDTHSAIGLFYMPGFEQQHIINSYSMLYTFTSLRDDELDKKLFSLSNNNDYTLYSFSEKDSETFTFNDIMVSKRYDNAIQLTPDVVDFITEYESKSEYISTRVKVCSEVMAEYAIINNFEDNLLDIGVTIIDISNDNEWRETYDVKDSEIIFVTDPEKIMPLINYNIVLRYIKFKNINSFYDIMLPIKLIDAIENEIKFASHLSLEIDDMQSHIIQLRFDLRDKKIDEVIALKRKQVVEKNIDNLKDRLYTIRSYLDNLM